MYLQERSATNTTIPSTSNCSVHGSLSSAYHPKYHESDEPLAPSSPNTVALTKGASPTFDPFDLLQRAQHTRCVCGSWIRKNEVDVTKHKEHLCRFKSFYCSHCFRIFGDQKLLFSHQRKMGHLKHSQTSEDGRDSIYFCNLKECDKAFMSKWEWTRHQKQHCKPFKCSYLRICRKSFAKKYDLEIHQRTHRPLQSEKCGFCGMKCKDPSNMRLHIRKVHLKDSVEKPFVCKYCLKPFVRKESLQKHFGTHLTVKDAMIWECNLCGMCCANKCNLKRHYKTAHGQ